MGGAKGRARLHSISSDGARIEKSTLPFTLGASLVVLFSLRQATEPIRLPSRIVRLTDTGGCAVEFVGLHLRVVRMLSSVLPRVAEAVPSDYDVREEWPLDGIESDAGVLEDPDKDLDPPTDPD